mmetsp:Transcript_22453/g.53221  ORF Transcript_22453/g.53221 Transcript_22453/m.53221 type:complete len:188 (-) Transcript_22453:204-767(-)
MSLAGEEIRETLRWLSTNHTTSNTTSTRMPDKAESMGNMNIDLDGKSMSERCFPVGECERCDSEQKSKSKSLKEECGSTGRRKKVECIVLKEDKELQRFESYRPCNRTIADEEFLMVQMQLICVLIGICSILAIQKQKKATASLFDQRKRIHDAYFWQGSDNLAGTTSKGNGEGTAAASILGDVEMV